MKLHQKQLLLLLKLIFCIASLTGQVIKIGEHCPDVKLTNIINASFTDVMLSDIRGKLIILDFWGTGCSACIGAFPEIDSLQKKFEGKVQFIAVNSESKDSTLRFLKRMKRIKLPAIPCITGDTILSNFFPHVYVPHHVWIDSNRVVRFITDGYNATEKHIVDFLKGKQLNLAEKKFEDDKYYDHPMQGLASAKWLDKVESYSLLMHAISGVTFSNGSNSTTENGKPNLTSQCNASILQLFATAYSRGGKYDFSAGNTIILELKDKFKYDFPKDQNLRDEWVKNYCYNYEFMVSRERSDHFYEYMQKDLTRYFNVKGTIEKRMVNCLVLVRTTREDKLKTNGGKPATNFSTITSDSMAYIKNHSFQDLVTSLKVQCVSHSLATPFYDETNYHGNIDIQINKGAFEDLDISGLQKELNKYGIAFKIKKKLVDVLVLKEIKKEK
jgi:thiol-disulfide isomerase/thioredoxin